LDQAETSTAAEAETRIEEAKAEQQDRLDKVSRTGKDDHQSKGVAGEDPKGLGYCTVWVGTTEEREHTDQSTMPQSKDEAEDWQLMQPEAGIAVVYLPFLSNPKVEGISPMTSPYMSTWNFIYTPDDVDNVVRLARANFEEGRERTRRTVRAVYERKKKVREERENKDRYERWRKKVRLGVVGKKGEGDQFS
jgi:phospholipase A2